MADDQGKQSCQRASAPRLQIRRFDVFAEWNRLKACNRHKMKEADARPYGLAIAKVVAARTLHGTAPEQKRELKRRAHQEQVEEPWWEHLGSSEEFEHKIIERMGHDFYIQVFQPSVQQAWDAGQRYEDIRDTLRSEWNARRPSSRKRGAGAGLMRTASLRPARPHPDCAGVSFVSLGGTKRCSPSTSKR